MKNLMQRVRTKAVTTVSFLHLKAADTFVRAKTAVANRNGEGALDIAIVILVSVVLGALILAGLYLILNATVLPSITQRIKDMFNYKG